MRFLYNAGEYKEFRGHVFMHGKPTTITDKATEEAVLQRSDFTRCKDEEIPKQAEQGKREEETPVLNNDACPKCGKIVRQGKYMHVRWCGTKKK